MNIKQLLDNLINAFKTPKIETQAEESKPEVISISIPPAGTTSKEEANKIGAEFGMTLLNFGINMVNSAYKGLPEIKMSFNSIVSAFNNAGQGGISFVNYDNYYWSATWEEWQKMIAYIYVVLQKIKYVPDREDCDDFATLFSVLANLLFGMNSAGKIWCNIYNKNTGAFIVPHYFNIIPTSDGKVYAYEPMHNLWMLIEKGKPIVMGNWKYTLLKATF